MSEIPTRGESGPPPRSGMSLTKAALVMLGVGAIALSGVPGIGKDPGPDGSLTGLCVDYRGFAVPEARIALFDAQSLELVETTRSDANGRFAFQTAPPTYSAFAEPPPSSTLSGTWTLDRIQENTAIELVLRPGFEVGVRVVDQEGRAIEGAEVRVFEVRRAPALVTHTLTDGEGRASLLAPPEAHIAVRSKGRPDRWLYELEIPPEGAHFNFHMPRGRLLTGRVIGPYGPVPGSVLSSRQTAEPEEWNGYAVTDEKGRFELLVSEAPTEIEVLDPSGYHLPTVRTVPSGTKELGDIQLDKGERISIQTLDADGYGLPTRVWLWSEQTQCWSYGRETDRAGRIDLAAEGRYSIVARPIFGGQRVLELWNKEPGTNPVELSAQRGVGVDR